MEFSTQFQQNLQLVHEKMNQACIRSHRNPNDIQIIAVSKYVSQEWIQLALRHGLKHIGENRWQDAKPKWEAISPQGIWHFIGHLQTNKVKDVIGKFSYIHSVDRLSLAQALEKCAQQMDIQVQICIQVNVSGEATKFGLHPDELHAFVSEVREYPHLQIIGLMTMAPHESHIEQVRPIFRGLRQLRDELNQKAILPAEVNHLSMGMSNDFEIAIEEGATWIRLGSILWSDKLV